MTTAECNFQTAIIGRFLLEDIVNLTDQIDPKSYLGFRDSKKHVAIFNKNSTTDNEKSLAYFES
jgi:hypothetical protein